METRRTLLVDAFADEPLAGNVAGVVPDAAGLSDDQMGRIAAEIGADSLSYLSLDAITTAIGKSESDLCVGCVSGEYPYDVQGEATDRDVEHPAAGTSADD